MPAGNRQSTLFYLDPPYWGRGSLYGKGLFTRADFEHLAARLAGLKGCFILSLNDLPEVRETFAAFDLEEVSISYAGGIGPRVTAAELLITLRSLPVLMSIPTSSAAPAGAVRARCSWTFRHSWGAA